MLWTTLPTTVEWGGCPWIGVVGELWHHTVLKHFGRGPMLTVPNKGACVRTHTHEQVLRSTDLYIRTVPLALSFLPQVAVEARPAQTHANDH